MISWFFFKGRKHAFHYLVRAKLKKYSLVFEFFYFFVYDVILFMNDNYNLQKKTKKNGKTIQI